MQLFTNDSTNHAKKLDRYETFYFHAARKESQRIYRLCARVAVRQLHFVSGNKPPCASRSGRSALGVKSVSRVFARARTRDSSMVHIFAAAGVQTARPGRPQ